MNYYDPVKGRLLGIAEREIKYKTPIDPALYNNNSNGNTKLAWGEEHIGEVWWDISRAKWLWYEQGSQEYKTNNWGKLFPGARINCYEWVESIFPPSEYLLQARSTEGVARGITGASRILASATLRLDSNTSINPRPPKRCEIHARHRHNGASCDWALRNIGKFADRFI